MNPNRILITGATGALGRATALLAAQGGAELILLGRSEDKLGALSDEICALGAPTPLLAALDFTEASIENYHHLAAGLADDGLDAMILNAVSFTGLHPIEHLPPQDWERMLTVNLSANYMLLGTLLPLLRDSGHGRVIAVTDPVAREHKAFWHAYGVAKVGLEALIGQIRGESGDRLSLCCFDPGPMQSAFRALAWPGVTRDNTPTPDQAAHALIALLSRERLDQARYDISSATA